MQRYEILYRPEDKSHVLDVVDRMLGRVTTSVRLCVEVGATPSVVQTRHFIGTARTAPKLKTKLSIFLREVRGMRTQRELQELLGINQAQYLSRVERGMIGMPNDRFLAALAKYTNRTVEELSQMAQEAV